MGRFGLTLSLSLSLSTRLGVFYQRNKQVGAATPTSKKWIALKGNERTIERRSLSTAAKTLTFSFLFFSHGQDGGGGERSDEPANVSANTGFD